MTTVDTRFDEERQSEEWKKEVARQMNVLIGRADFFKNTSNDESDQEVEAATMELCERVRIFEEILTVEEADVAYGERKREGRA
jgi:hypothetical protein